MKNKILIFSAGILMAIGGIIYGVNSSNASGNCPMTAECSTPAQCKKATDSGYPITADCCKK